MKRLILTLCLTFPILAQSQCDTVNLQDRQVIGLTVQLWQDNYETVLQEGLLGASLEPNGMRMSKSTYDMYFNEGNYDASSINFCYYLGSDGDLNVALQTDVESYITYDYANEGWQTTERPDLLSGFQNWYNLASNPDKPLVYVELYSFDKSYIDSLFENTSMISIENVVHSVSPDTKRYKLPTTYKGQDADLFEGFLAFDVLIKTDGALNQQGFYNFAKPCPKICNKAIFKK